MQLGKMLSNMRNELLELHAEVWSTPGSRHRKAAVTALFRAHQKIDEARHHLEEIMFSDHQDVAHTHVYYGLDQSEREGMR